MRAGKGGQCKVSLSISKALSFRVSELSVSGCGLSLSLSLSLAGFEQCLKALLVTINITQMSEAEGSYIRSLHWPPL